MIPGPALPGARTGRAASPLARLLAEPRRFTFDAAVRVLSFHRRQADPAQAARYANAVGLAFPGAEVTDIQDNGTSAPPLVTVGLTGLTGPSGVLPRHYSDAVVATQRGGSRALSGFLALLSERMIAAFAAAGAKYRPHRAADTSVLSATRTADGDPVAAVLLALTGYGIARLAGRLPAGAAPLRHYAGLFAAHPRSADRLEALASDWLGRPVRVRQFAGAWLAVPPDQRTRMPVGITPGAFTQLGHDAAAGVRAWDQQARIMLLIGPLDLPSFERLLPDRPALVALVALVRSYVGFEIGFAVNLVLGRDCVPALALRGDADPPPRLGWNTWLPLAPGGVRRADVTDAVFEAEIVEGQAS